MIFSKHNFLVYYCQLNQIKMKVYFRWQYLGNGTRYWHAVFAGRQTVSGSSFLVRQCPMTSGLNSEIRSFENVKKCKICKKSIFYKRCAITLRIFWRLQPLSNFQPLTKYRPFQHENWKLWYISDDNISVTERDIDMRFSLVDRPCRVVHFWSDNVLWLPASIPRYGALKTSKSVKYVKNRFFIKDAL